MSSGKSTHSRCGWRLSVRTHFARLLVLLAAAVAAGCAVNQQKETAPYRELLEGEEEGEHLRYSPGGPLTLDVAMKLAARHNERLASQGENYVQALIAKQRAVSSLLPTFNSDPHYVLRQKAVIPGFEQSLTNRFVPPKAADVPINGQLDISVDDIERLGIAGAIALQQRALVLDLKATILLDVAGTYFQILIFEQQVDVLQTSVASQQVRVQNMQTRFNAGMATQADLAQAKAQLAGTRSQLIKAENDLHNSRALLALLIGVPSVEGQLTGELEASEAVPKLGPLLQVAYRHRQDLQAAEARVEAARKNVQAAWAEYIPSLSINASYWILRQSFPQSVLWRSSYWLNIPLFTACLIREDIRRAWSQLRQAKFAEMYLCRQILKELRVAMEDLRDSRRQIVELKIQTEAAQKALQQTEKGFNYGQNTNLQRLVAQDQYLTAQLNLASERYNEKVQYLNLLRVIGCLGPDFQTVRLMNLIEQQQAENSR